MSKITKLVMNTPPSGWRWELVAGGRTIKSGNANSEKEAHTAADSAVAAIAAANANEEPRKSN